MSNDTMSNDDVIDELNTLIETCKDGEYGFRTCAEHVKSDQLRQVFTSRADECRKGATELQSLVTRLGGKPDTGSSVSGTVHRGWVNVKGMLTGDSDQAALNECERGEDAALERYRDAIKKTLPDDVAAVVQRQYEGVKRNHDQIRTLRDQVRSTA
ncbi:MAG TPA: PA2169 family four-helix-bundle protein [Caldimonas sp.]|nr:PA2169 family four-helix-bundle protein [Caldimonas sp.]